MNNSLRLFVVSVIILGLFTQVLSQNLDLLKELTIYKDSLNSKSGERVEAMRRIETHFSKENLHETAKILEMKAYVPLFQCSARTDRSLFPKKANGRYYRYNKYQKSF